MARYLRSSLAAGNHTRSRQLRALGKWDCPNEPGAACARRTDRTRRNLLRCTRPEVAQAA
jgi:hypothetical protein